MTEDSYNQDTRTVDLTKDPKEVAKVKGLKRPSVVDTDPDPFSRREPYPENNPYITLQPDDTRAEFPEDAEVAEIGGTYWAYDSDRGVLYGERENGILELRATDSQLVEALEQTWEETLDEEILEE